MRGRTRTERPALRPPRPPTGVPAGSWLRAVRKFTRESLSRAYVGEAWKHRIRYEVLRTPQLLLRAGEGRPPRTPRSLRKEHLDRLRSGLPWATTTLALHLAALRRFARWAGNPLASEVGAWAVPAGVSSHRRWLSRSDLARLYRASRGLERTLVSLEAFNGLRRVEVLRLRGCDVDLAAHRLHVLGKGKSGGKWRTIPLFSETERILRRTRDRGLPETRVVPASRSGADLLLQRAARRAGFPGRGLRVSHHDLRRTFGRLSYRAGMDLVQLKNLYGHSSLDQTVHYIGLDEDRMRAGLDSLARSLHPFLGR
jgi:integrase